MNKLKHRDIIKDLTELKSIVYDIKITQGDIQEGLLNIPPNVNNSDPLTPLDQNFATHEDLAKHYRLFMDIYRFYRKRNFIFYQKTKNRNKIMFCQCLSGFIY